MNRHGNWFLVASKLRRFTKPFQILGSVRNLNLNGIFPHLSIKFAAIIESCR